MTVRKKDKLARVVAITGLIILGVVAMTLVGEIKLSNSLMSGRVPMLFSDEDLTGDTNIDNNNKKLRQMEASLQQLQTEIKEIQQQMTLMRQQQQQQNNDNRAVTAITTTTNNKSVNFNRPLNTDPNAKYLANCQDIANEDSSLHSATVTKVNVQTTIKTSSFDMALHQINDDRVVSHFVRKFGCFDCHLWSRTLQALEENENSFLLDIGSNIGLFGLSAAAIGKSVYAFEPFKKNYRRICQSLIQNPTLQPYMTIYQSALSDTGPNIIKYRQPFRRNPSALSIVETRQQYAPQDNNNINDDKKEEEGVDYGWAVTLDSLQDSLPINRPVVIKMDVEGYECHVIKGGMDYLQKLNIQHVILELNGKQLLQNCPNRREMFDLFTSNGLRPIKWYNEAYSYPLDPNDLQLWIIDGSQMFDVEWVPII